MSSLAEESWTADEPPDVEALSGGDWMLGSNSLMRRLACNVVRAATAQCTVLFAGETGTGKEVFARLLHKVGPRASKPFIPVNCAALTTTLAESQLFGHERGAFTGAAVRTLGVFRAADHGIVFLDEIGEMPYELQPKLLRVLQQQEVTPVGASHPEFVQVQIVAATNRDLRAEVAAGRFREDLFYRLNLMALKIPSLRERAEDIPAFVEFYSRRFAARYQRPHWAPTDETLRKFVEYSWPGNIRQLAHLVEQSYVLGGEPHLPEHDFETAEDCGNLPYVDLERLRRAAIRQALRTTKGHKGRAAKLLGVHPNTLTRLLNQLDSPTSGGGDDLVDQSANRKSMIGVEGRSNRNTNATKREHPR